MGIVILGIDPGLTHTGWAIIEINHPRLVCKDHGTISSSASEKIEQRLGKIYKEISRVIDVHKPKECAIEETIVNVKNPRSSLKLAHARAAGMLAATLYGLFIAEYPPTQVKKSIVGLGGAGKDQVEYMIKNLFPTIFPKTKDASDAIAIAVCHAFRRKTYT